MYTMRGAMSTRRGARGFNRAMSLLRRQTRAEDSLVHIYFAKTQLLAEPAANLTRF